MKSGAERQGVTSGRARYQVVPRVLVFARYEDDVLLLRGATNRRVWPSLLNGVGGHVERGEDTVQAARRELLEESGLDCAADSFQLRAVISIDTGEGQAGVLLFVFVVRATSRALAASQEGRPEWHRITKLDGLPLVEDLPWLLPRVLDDTRQAILFARYRYDKQQALVIEDGTVPDR